jgi:hypothetical protein
MTKLEAGSKEFKLCYLILRKGAKGFKSSIDSIELQASLEDKTIDGRFSSRGRLFYFELKANTNGDWSRAWSAQPIVNKE